jgi:hypothetical protein
MTHSHFVSHVSKYAAHFLSLLMLYYTLLLISSVVSVRLGRGGLPDLEGLVLPFLPEQASATAESVLKTKSQADVPANILPQADPSPLPLVIAPRPVVITSKPAPPKPVVVAKPTSVPVPVAVPAVKNVIASPPPAQAHLHVQADNGSILHAKRLKCRKRYTY